MKKDTYYFSHDYNARNDRKMVNLRLKLKMEGLGVYWVLVEMLYEEGGQLSFEEIPIIENELRIKKGLIEQVVKGFELFENDGSFFWSNSVKRRLDKRMEKSNSAKESAASRWTKPGYNEFKHDLPQVYVIRCFNEYEDFLKVGITEEYISRRYSGKKMPYKYEIVKQFFTKDYIKIEGKLTDLLENYRYDPITTFYGKYECYDLDAIDLIESFEDESIIHKYTNSDAIRRNAPKSQRNAIKERKVKESKGNIYTPPTIEEVVKYFTENGYSEDSAKTAFKYYNDNDWHDSTGKKVIGWKQKMVGNWFRDENKSGTSKKQFVA